jgi:hypothetical protein
MERVSIALAISSQFIYGVGWNLLSSSRPPPHQQEPRSGASCSPSWRAPTASSWSMPGGPAFSQAQLRAWSDEGIRLYAPDADLLALRIPTKGAAKAVL